MKLGFYDDFKLCVITDKGVVDVSDVAGTAGDGTFEN